MAKRLSALCAATAAAMALGVMNVSAADTAKASRFYNSATLLGVDEYGNKAGFSSVTDITGISAVTFTFRVDEDIAKKAVNGEIELTGTLGTDSDTYGKVSHEWAFEPYKLDDNGEVMYDDDLLPVPVKELTLEKIMDGYYCVTLEEPTGFFKDEDTYAKVWFDCDSNDYEVALTGVVLSFDDSKIVKNLSNAKMSITQSSYTYSGSACKPAATVSYGNKFLKEGTDFTLSYKNNVKAGTATVTATGKGKYKGSVSKTFTIKKRSLKGAVISMKGLTYAYTGKAVKPKPTVKLGGKTLVSGTDYTVSYSNNVEIGTAVVKITGKGSYSGSVSGSYVIKPKKSVIKTVTSPKTKQAKVTWSKNTSGEGYQIVYADNSSFASSKSKTVSGNTKTTANITSLTKGKTYYFKVRAYKTVGDKKIYGDYSSAKSVKVS